MACRYHRGMRLAEFHELLADEFGRAKARHIVHSHYLASLGGAVGDLVENGVDLRRIWEGICRDFDVPEERRLGRDLPGR